MTIWLPIFVVHVQLPRAVDVCSHEIQARNPSPVQETPYYPLENACHAVCPEQKFLVARKGIVVMAAGGGPPGAQTRVLREQHTVYRLTCIRYWVSRVMGDVCHSQ